MSIDCCSVCGVFIDTDWDGDAYFLFYDEDENKESGELDSGACHCEQHRYFDFKQQAQSRVT